MSRLGLEETKPEYRYKYFKDFQNTIIAVSGGTVAATMAFTSSLDGKLNSPFWMYLGLVSLGSSIFLHILILFFAYIGSGLMWDNFMGHPRGQSETEKAVGKLITWLVALSLFLTPIGFASLFWFVTKNIV